MKQPSKSILNGPLLVLAGSLLSYGAVAATVQTTGTGSAVTTVEASASFETSGALFDNPYVEGGMLFSRSNLTFDNNSCGFAGCAGHLGFTGFSGNYMYGTGDGGFFTIQAGGSSPFFGLEMQVGSGFSQSNVLVVWEAFSGATLVGSGNVNTAVGSVVGFSDSNGFDSLRFTSSNGGDIADFNNTFNAPAFDSVRAQFTAPVPLPGSLGVMGIGVAALVAMRRRRSA